MGNPGGLSKRSVWIDGGIHAREWVSPAAVSFFMSELVENSGRHQTLLDKYDFYIMPSANPDGYEYSRSYDRSHYYSKI